MEFDCEPWISARRVGDVTSAQGMVLTAPLSSSARRWFTSVAQAASASSATSVSRLSSKDAASAARSSLGSPSASLRMSAAFRFAVRLYEVQSWRRPHRKPSAKRAHVPRLSSSGCITIDESEEKAGGTQRREHRSPSPHLVRAVRTCILACCGESVRRARTRSR